MVSALFGLGREMREGSALYKAARVWTVICGTLMFVTGLLGTIGVPHNSPWQVRSDHTRAGLIAGLLPRSSSPGRPPRPSRSRRRRASPGPAGGRPAIRAARSAGPPPAGPDREAR